MRWDHHNTAVISDLRLYRFREIAENGTRFLQRSENLLRESEHADELIIPVFGLRIYKLAGAGNGIFRGALPGEEEVIIIRRHEKRIRLFKLFRAFLLQSGKLIDSVEYLFCDAGPGIEVFLRDNLIDFSVNLGSSVIPVSDGIPDPFPGFIDQNIVNTPGINPHIGGNFPKLRTLFHSLFDVGKEQVGVPALVAVDFLHSVFEAKDFFQHDLSVFQMAQDVPAAGGADVNRKKILFHTDQITPFWRITLA